MCHRQFTEGGGGGTKKEAKRQAAGAVLERISSPADTEGNGQIETKDKTEEIANNNEINVSKDEVASESSTTDLACMNDWSMDVENDGETTEYTGHNVKDKDERIKAVKINVDE